jgi:acyl-CoA reductase-like NAD-dependent aldehyde dehydrogenase
MVVDEKAIRDLVEEVVRQVRAESGAASESDSPYSGVFDDIYAAIYAADKAFVALADTSLETRRAMISEMRRIILENADRLSRLAVEETGMGRVEDKIVKNRLAAERTPGVEDLEPLATTDDEGLTLTERAPYGVIGAIAPSTNPTETIINNAIGMIAAGNTVVFNAHPAAKHVSALTVTLLNDAIQKAGGPKNVITTVATPTIESATEMMKHPMIRLLAVTGGPGVVRAALATTKKVIAAGPGNPPVVVDETADIPKAARDIVSGASLDNNIICIDEKEVLAVDAIADRLKAEMAANGAYELNGDQIDRLTKKIIADPGREGHEGMANKEYVGRDAAKIAEAIGLTVPADTRVLLCEVDRSHPLIWTEQLMPVLPIARFATADEAIDYAVRCEHGFRHTASIHSNDIRNLSRMAKVMNCSLFVKNGSNYSGLAAGGPGFTSFTIASPTGEGFTRARTFTRERRCTLIGSFRIV